MGELEIGNKRGLKKEGFLKAPKTKEFPKFKEGLELYLGPPKSLGQRRVPTERKVPWGRYIIPSPLRKGPHYFQGTLGPFLRLG